MKEMKQNRKTKYTQLALQDALMELMEQKPIFKITIKELCERADINRTTFYAHYTDQNDLLHKIEHDVLLSFRKFIDSLHSQMDKSSIVHIIQGFLQYIADNDKHIQILLSERGDINFQKKLFTMIYEQCEIMNLAVPSSTTEFYFIFVLNGSIGLIQHWLKYGLTKSTYEMAEIIFNMTAQIK
ncbi:AcrR family transcriptional regulator [Clostridium saccharoperbutylacetonicum]|uniref:Transcriptional regulator, TetR family n=1 Tax=Clostridium saccharoperbutylacetonicum N1-4(HMT) TaxID=931276 RepID=M1MHU2_9CLOT|nr:TetR/AcrR family transcriptional regulator [Clostridium saccharoperbutylacetonicum]AGF55888.1 transcriptional regulator, TetR family [Clostridium saccharoperbutylacetonicum N1-4(HMT)]NRT63373.1 AcrR family transcriptional regulator [Clostridium saccharoperbutylacetonicum]NSB26735.1 AcrR family transcriptional regulator [Clostridium saccharoperbutylacetonicum]NSB46087.1 AcrR family transcriptional regulator [Clostridium saccharoperbutylacetonicum]